VSTERRRLGVKKKATTPKAEKKFFGRGNFRSRNELNLTGKSTEQRKRTGVPGGKKKLLPRLTCGGHGGVKGSGITRGIRGVRGHTAIDRSGLSLSTGDIRPAERMGGKDCERKIRYGKKGGPPPRERRIMCAEGVAVKRKNKFYEKKKDFRWRTQMGERPAREVGGSQEEMGEEIKKCGAVKHRAFGGQKKPFINQEGDQRRTTFEP